MNGSINCQVGIGTHTPNPSSQLEVASADKGLLIPRMTSVQRMAISTPAQGLLVYQTDLNAGFYYYTGAEWTRLNNGTSPEYGDIKSGVQLSDHNGWIKLDGRSVNTLSINQKAVALSLGISTNLPDATNRSLIQQSNILQIGGSDSVSIERRHLPAIEFEGFTNSTGEHSHTGSTSFNGDHNHNYSDVGRGGNRIITNFSIWGTSLATTDQANANTSNNGNHNHTFTTNNNGNHSHSVTVSSGGSNHKLYTKNPYLSVNYFIYLGM